MVVEYRVKEIKRYIVTRCESNDDSASVAQIGEYPSGETAYAVGYALCRQDHEKSGEPVGSTNFIYPTIPDGTSVPPVSIG